MGMGHAANHVVRVHECLIKKLCRDEWKNLAANLAAFKVDGTGLTMGDLALLYKREEEIPEEVREAFTGVCSAFKAKTGIDISIDYHDSENEGSRYDDIQGVYWYALDGVFIRTKAGDKYKEHLTEEGFVTFG